MRSGDMVVALLSHTRGRGVNPKPFEAGAGLPSPQHKSPWVLVGARPSKRANTRQSTGPGDDVRLRRPILLMAAISVCGNRDPGGPLQDQTQPAFPGSNRMGFIYPMAGVLLWVMNAAATEAATAMDAGEDGQLGVDVVPYSAPSTDMALLGSGAVEQQVSSEISALMQAALQSGRQVDVELPSGAVMRIR